LWMEPNPAEQSGAVFRFTLPVAAKTGSSDG